MSDAVTQDRASELCQQCGLCCVGSVCGNVEIALAGDESFVEQFSDDILIASDHGHRWVVQPCPAFDGKCTVYEIRPLDCRTYRCNLLEQAYSNEMTFEEASSIVQSAVSAQRELAHRFSETTGQQVSWQSVYPLVKAQHSAALDRGEEKQFWRLYPEYLRLCFLRDRHFLPGTNVLENLDHEEP